MKRTTRLPMRRDLGLQLLMFHLLFVGLMVLSVLLFQDYGQRRLGADITAANLALAHAVAQETSTAMYNALETVRHLAAEPAVLAADVTGMASLFRTTMHGRNDVNLTYRLDAQGVMQFHYPVAPESTVGVDFSFRDYFQRALTSRQPLLSQGRISPTTNEPVATAVMPIWGEDGRFQGVVATNLRLQSLSDTLASITTQFQPAEEMQLLIIDHTGKVVAHSDPQYLLQDAAELIAAPVVTAVLSRQSGNRIAMPPAHNEYLYSYVPIAHIGWGVVVGRPTAAAFASAVAFQRSAFLAIAIFLLGGVLFWFILFHRVIQPLERLAAFSQNADVGRGLGGQSPLSLHALTERPDQMGLLTRSLRSMQAAIDARLNELSTLLETSAAVVSSLDQATVLDRILEQVGRLLNVHMSAIFALDEGRGIFRVYASRGLPQWYTEQATIDPDEPSSVTMRAIRSGQPIQISDTETNPSFKLHRQRAAQAGYRAVMAVPLRVTHTPPAALLVFRPDVHEFDRQETNLLVNFANHAAMAMENAALFAQSDMQLQEQTGRLEALIQSMQDGLVLEALDGRILYANRRQQTWSGLSPEACQGQPGQVWREHILQRVTAAVSLPVSTPHTPMRDAAQVRRSIAAALQGQVPRHIEFPSLDGERLVYLRLRLFDVTDAEGTPMGRGWILQDITQRYELDRLKSSLIATVSHELRTPLAAVKGYTTTLLAEDVQWDAQSQREFLQIILTETDRLSRLVTDLLDMSRLEAGSLRVSRVACELGELVEQAAQQVYPYLDGRLQVQLPVSLPRLYVDPPRITAVLRNLIENAVKYSQETSPIWVTAVSEPAANRLVVRVIDDGPGIPAEHSQQVFASFFRVESGLAQQTTGAGLGLAISRGFVQAHGGSIWLESPGKGACVAFSIPLTVVEDGEEVIIQPAVG